MLKEGKPGGEEERRGKESMPRGARADVKGLRGGDFAACVRRGEAWLGRGDSLRWSRLVCWGKDSLGL